MPLLVAQGLLAPTRRIYSPEVIYCNRGIAVCAERISVCALIKWAVYSNFNGIGKCLSPIFGFNNNNSIRIVSMCKTTEGNIYCSSGWITWINGNPGSLNNMLTFAQFDGFAPSGTTVCGPGKDNSTPDIYICIPPKKQNRRCKHYRREYFVGNHPLFAPSQN